MMKKNNFLLTESLAGTLSVYLILKKLMQDFDQWDAYRLGLIDKDGNRLKYPVNSKEREAWDILTRFTWNIKKIATKFIGKSKFASYFTAAYLLKDSLNLFYIQHNLDRLNESLLSDMSYAKQNEINNILKLLPPINESINDSNIELMMYKYLHIIENMVELEQLQKCLFEEDAAPPASPSIPAGTVQSDIAQVAQYLGVKKRKTKRKGKKYESK